MLQSTIHQARATHMLQSTIHQARGIHINRYTTDVALFIDFKEIM
jgi:hypothetical protein